MFVQLVVISKARNKFVEIVAAADCNLIITHMEKKNSETKKQSFRICVPVTICLKLMGEYQ